MSEPVDPEDLRLDRDLTRQELGETVAALTDKLDVPARAKDKVHATTEAAKQQVTDAKYQALATADQARDMAGQAARTPAIPLAAAALAAGVAVWLIARRRR
ncbi:DUF3618 domain-containing protein [Nocardia sp. AG03]|uniref:DUF3618 domain-containing protein n=1 Tax=Nocardia sp. AG03 TaxID=3025312 RepID=UPI0024182FFA|nr:DUF3618 domain-containing protein [Nocardia sp. AG03]